MRKLLWGIAVMILIALAAGAYYVISNHQYYSVTESIPFKGEAHKNPLYASRLFLKQMGIPATSIKSLQGIREYPDYDTVIVLNSQRESFLEEDLMELLGWVEEGGHLIVNSAPDWDYIEDFNESQDNSKEEDIETSQCQSAEEGAGEPTNNEEDVDSIKGCDEAENERYSSDYIQQELDVYTFRKVYLKNNSKKTEEEVFDGSALDLYNITLSDSKEEKTLALQSYFLAIHSSHEKEYKVIIEGNLFLLEREYGEGMITLASDLSFIENELIRFADNAEIFWHLIHSYYEEPAEVWLIHRTQMPSILILMWQKGSAVVISLALLLMAWMYRVAQRLGPVIHKQKPQRRELMEHIQASGRYHWQHKNQAHLLDATRQALMRRINQLHPAWQHDSADEQIQYLSEMLQQPEADLYTLLFGDYKELSTNEFMDIIQRLEAIRRQL